MFLFSLLPMNKKRDGKTLSSAGRLKAQPSTSTETNGTVLQGSSNPSREGTESTAAEFKGRPVTLGAFKGFLRHC
jgi:hypothetical protein